MTGRLIVVSNRVPSDGPPSGGLVVALDDCLQARGGLWVGTSGHTVDSPGDSFERIEGRGYDILTFDLTDQEHEDYYLSYCNSLLWPICHRRNDLIDIRPGAFAAYIGVNQRLAAMLAKVVQPGDRLWIHDYHFLPLATCLRDLGVDLPMGYFHHIPFPTLQDIVAMPQADLFPGYIAAYDLVGLQTNGDVNAAKAMFRGLPNTKISADGLMQMGEKSCQISAFPIGIDAFSFQRDATKREGRALLNLFQDERLVIGVDRLDYSKGLTNRLRGFGQFLTDWPEDAGYVSLLQVAPPSREDVPAYQDIRNELERIAGQVNGDHSQLGWTPIRYLHSSVERETLASLYRAADVGLVTPMCDGMNLVAKEYVAAQDPDDPGVLVLSKTAGAAEQLGAAVLVNPYDTGNIADGLKMALTMSLFERTQRYQALASSVFGEHVEGWTRNYLAALDALG